MSGFINHSFQMEQSEIPSVVEKVIYHLDALNLKEGPQLKADMMCKDRNKSAILTLKSKIVKNKSKSNFGTFNFKKVTDANIATILQNA